MVVGCSRADASSISRCVCVAWTVRWSALRGTTKHGEYTNQHLPTDTLQMTPCNRICRTSARAHTSSSRLLRSSHVCSRDKGLQRGILSGGGVRNGFLLERVRGEGVPCRFCGEDDRDGHLFLECSYPLLSLWSKFVKIPEIHDFGTKGQEQLA